MSDHIFTEIRNGMMIVTHPTTKQKEYFKFDPYNSKSYDEMSVKLRGRKREMVDEIAAVIGRQPTGIELVQGYVDSKFDSRNTLQKMNDSDWRVQVNSNKQTNTQRLLAETEKQLSERKNYSNDPLEHQREILEEMADKESEQALANIELQEHLTKVGPKLQRIDSLISSENWNVNSDQSFRSLLGRAKRQLLEPNGDKVETLRLLKQVDAVIQEEQVAKSQILQEEAEALGKRIQQNQMAQDLLGEDESNESTS